MLSPERHTRILQALTESPAVRVADLAATLGVSDMTIRRDIDLLDEKHLLKKIHGGASRLDVLSSIEPGFAYQADKQLRAKRHIAARARQLIADGMTIALGAGTTTVQLAGMLVDVERLTVITNSIKAAEKLYALDPRNTTVILTGGQRTPSEALVGPLSVAAINSLKVDLCFLGVHGIHPSGLSTPNLPEAQSNAAFIKASRKLVILADHTKFGLRALASFASLDQVNVLITDSGLPKKTEEDYRALVPELLVAA
ncbi:DeoR/GlpR family transcriptional regulator of sugar metabolism [Psychromicrobium silvestre]|uniref:DeoR/GlpR family transcriptional regulator of sugar metabolism n=1 Tax=Psychromicrobium silvestre TaxID=1645614 RepID=A0A7Y9LVS5_9MICC|nr:DeoR/GlpR family DNA-binding transcription regulator [Psychromicrobium silvestre]NYE96519.1 DeoR/GlpR family transcriptional regulator of sugar metabolism [Psychromicrobium silvestre]